MAKQEEIKVLSETPFTRTLEKPIYTGAKENRKKIGSFQTTALKPEAEAVIEKALKAAGIAISGVVAAYNYGKDLIDRSASSPARPGMETSVVKIKGTEIDLLALSPEKAIAYCNAARSFSETTGQAVSRAYAYTAGQLVSHGKATEKGGVLTLKK
jgi:hypothetical protein